MDVDWKQQWALFAKNFYDGLAHIPLAGDKTLLLLPGPGFGDLSHPTTALMLEMMHPLVSQESIVDIGTGSGILALSALLLGANSSFGIDIDPEALLHAKENNELNHLNARFNKKLPPKLPPSIFLMNMILSEQRVAFQKHPSAKLWITSGILESQESEYLAQADKWGLKVRSRHQNSEWLGFILAQKELFA
jgi:ribosomal protein L11 methyltransferase